ncbi:MAG TPA: macro domain-containing protein [Acidimicrobiia bacterium]|nr:macro domain-containing protein [Acidimicrobiia bacterium]
MGIEVVTADITTLEVDAIVNAANESLAHGGGVAAAIARAGTPVVNDESAQWIDKHGLLEAGQSAYTGAGSMPARWVIHVVGPRYGEGQDNESLLRGAVAAALDRGAELGARSIALPAISAGIFGYPLDEATFVIASEVSRWLTEQPDALDRVVLVGYDERTATAFEHSLEGLD